MLEVKHIKSGYAGVPVVFDVSFEVKQGQIVGLLGSNGAGKTTTLKTVTGLLKPMAGEVVFEGNSIAGKKAHEVVKLGISMVPEGRQLFPKMSVQDNLIMGSFNIRDKAAIRQELDEVYAMFPRVKERLKQQAGTLSGGEQQMVAIARGMMAKPKLMIMDEPSLGLMPSLVKDMFQFIEKIRDLGVTVILVEQNVDATLKIADYSYVIQNGETILHGTKEEMLNSEQIKRAYLGM